MLIYLFGGYERTCHMGRMRFLTKSRAMNYPNSFDGCIDPYARGMTGPATFVPGALFRTSPR